MIVESKAKLAIQLRRVCHDTLPQLISERSKEGSELRHLLIKGRVDEQVGFG